MRTGRHRIADEDVHPESFRDGGFKSHVSKAGLEKTNLTDKTRDAMCAFPKSRARAMITDALETQFAAAEADASGEPFTKPTSPYTTIVEAGERAKKEVPVTVLSW